jgi:hypothetical protein
MSNGEETSAVDEACPLLKVDYAKKQRTTATGVTCEAGLN